MHPEILSREQTALLPFLKKYIRSYYLVGGTAISLHLGHRRSIDFDLFTSKSISTAILKKQISTTGFPYHLIVQKADQIHFILNGVKLTFFEFPFAVPATMKYENFFNMPDLLTLSAMKAFALGGRGKWKDYVDLFFILKYHFSINEVAAKAAALFEGVFNPTLFYKQLTYFDDISFAEPVEFMPGFEVEEKEVKDFLTDAALTGF